MRSISHRFAILKSRLSNISLQIGKGPLRWEYFLCTLSKVHINFSSLFYYSFFLGAMDPRCKICIFMGKTDFDAARHKQQVRSQKMLLCESEGRKTFLKKEGKNGFSKHAWTFLYIAIIVYLCFIRIYILLWNKDYSNASLVLLLLSSYLFF